MLRVGTIKYKNGRKILPSYPGFSPIEVMTKSSAYGELGPYCLKDDNGYIMENIWQASKVYETVPPSTQRYSRYDQTIIWNWPGQRHVQKHDGQSELTPEYWDWRRSLISNPYPVRYPVGFNHRHKVLFSFIKDPNEKLGYIEARKKIYVPIYSYLVSKHPMFHKLQERLREGENLLIMEVDGPKQELLPYYMEKYGVDSDFIVNDTMAVTARNIDIMLNDPSKPYGHGYCLAMALLGK